MSDSVTVSAVTIPGYLADVILTLAAIGLMVIGGLAIVGCIRAFEMFRRRGD
jgi:hypothetical protein